MNRVILMCIVAGMSVASLCYGQVTIEWQNLSAAIGPDTNAVMTGVDYTSGALFQLIRASGGVDHGPTASDFGTGSGTSGGDALQGWTFAATFVGDGQMYRQETYPSLLFTEYVYVRVWTLPSSGSGNLNAAPSGMYYYDTMPVLVSTLPGGGVPLYTYNFTAPTEDSWTFLAIPEPTSMALGLLGLGVILIRRRLMRK